MSVARQRTNTRKALIRERIGIASALWSKVATFDEIWLRLHNRRGGFTDVEIDSIITNPSTPGAEKYSVTENLHHFRLLRAFPHSRAIIEDPVARARNHAAKTLDAVAPPPLPDSESDSDWVARRRHGTPADSDEEMQVAIYESMKRVDTLCPICRDPEQLYRVSFGCSHAYCAGCIIGQFAANRNALNRCPGCILNRTAYNDYIDCEETRMRLCFLGEEAIGVMDPHFLRLVPNVPNLPKISDMIKSGIQLDAFMPPDGSMYRTNESAKCPHCRQRILGTPGPGGPLIFRCTSATCGVVFCGHCNRDYSPDHVCEVRDDMATVAEVARTSKRCPSCNAPVSHYRDHGCHRIRCGNPGCTHRFCYVCLHEVYPDDDDPDDEALEVQTCRCPPFCPANGSCGCLPCPDCANSRPCPMRQ